MPDLDQATKHWFNAVHAGSLDEVARLLKDHASDRDPQGETALMIAARANNLQLVELIQDCSHSQRNYDDETALMIAAKLDHSEIVNVLALVESSIKKNAGDTALHVAIKNRSFESVKILLEFLETEKNAEGYNAIDYAVSLGDEEMVDHILSSTLSLGKKQLEHAAEVAANHKYQKISSYLQAIIAKKAKPGSLASFKCPNIQIVISPRVHLTDDAKKSAAPQCTNDEVDKYQRELEALRAQLAEKDKEIAEKDREQQILTNQLNRVKEQSKDQSIARPIRKIMGGEYGTTGRTEGSKTAMAHIKSNEPFERDCEGNTPLMLAVEEHDYKKAAELVEEQGGLKNVYGTTALMIAASRGYIDLVQLLLEKEAGLQANSGTTALMKAAHNGHYEVCKLLAPREITKTRRDGWTAVMSAATNNHCEIIDILSDEIGMQTMDGTTALHKAVVHNHLDAVKRLADREHHLRLKNGSTAFYMVNREKNPEMHAFLATYK